ncbi:GntR family transcriptional regulator [Streptomyces zhaozhouensis]|uniref:GntR family transcriptional regulator n=1 Tax=Streptomyces zhaozhouensis TaxID=1300267 RepID=A0A286DU49_9ACTN|nr:GntR family transcriptional regulator [Streptomyces zhaozhouensis]SOD62094.1 GntR family transcriptional regulator [Streptomyces zhaozhouensis]
MGEIQRPGALYQQVAAEIRSGIAAGEYPPGALLPSEAQLMERYQVSRPTVRKAVDRLRSEGLIDVVHGKGSFVRSIPTPSVTIDRTITREGDTFRTGLSDWAEVEPPTVTRGHTTATTGPLLGLEEGEAVFLVDRLLADPTTGTRAMHRMVIPLATAAEVEELENPDISPDQVYAALAKAGHHLTWRETVSARMPLPDERAALDIPEAMPVLSAAHIATGDNDRPLILERMLTSASRTQLSYAITGPLSTSGAVPNDA